MRPGFVRLVWSASALLVAACGAPQTSLLRGQLVGVERRSMHQQFVREITQHAREAAALVRRALGAPADGPLVPIVFSASDAPGDPHQCGGHSGGEHLAYATNVKRGDVIVAGQIVFCLDLLARSSADPRLVLRHEVVHVVLSQVVGRHRRTIPRWFEEGLAEHVSGKGEERVDVRLRMQLADPLAGVVSVAVLDAGGPEAVKGKYHVAYLAARALLERAGPATLPRFVASLKAGTPFWSALTQAAGAPREALVAFADAAVRQALTTAAQTGGRAEYAAAESALRTSPDAGRARLEGFVARFPRSPYAVSARLQLASAYLRKKDAKAALAQTSQLMRVAAHATEPARLAHARSLYGVGRVQEALRLLADVISALRDVPALQASAKELHEMWSKAGRAGAR